MQEDGERAGEGEGEGEGEAGEQTHIMTFIPPPLHTSESGQDCYTCGHPRRHGAPAAVVHSPPAHRFTITLTPTLTLTITSTKTITITISVTIGQ